MDPARGVDAMPVRIRSRPSRVRPWNAFLPKGVGGRNVVAILTGSNDQVASRVWLDAGRELALRVIVDTGMRVPLVREALLPPEMTVAPFDAATAQWFDMNGGLIPIMGTVTHQNRFGPVGSSRPTASSQDRPKSTCTKIDSCLSGAVGLLLPTKRDLHKI